jgi:hypothetical protein
MIKDLHEKRQLPVVHRLVDHRLRPRQRTKRTRQPDDRGTRAKASRFGR